MTEPHNSFWSLFVNKRPIREGNYRNQSGPRVSVPQKKNRGSPEARNGPIGTDGRGALLVLHDLAINPSDLRPARPVQLFVRLSLCSLLSVCFSPAWTVINGKIPGDRAERPSFLSGGSSYERRNDAFSSDWKLEALRLKLRSSRKGTLRKLCKVREMFGFCGTLCVLVPKIVRVRFGLGLLDEGAVKVLGKLRKQDTLTL